MADDTDHAEIRRIAYQIWLEAGQPEGRDREHWEAAKEAWAFRQRGMDAAQPAPGGSKPKRATKPRGKPTA